MKYKIEDLEREVRGSLTLAALKALAAACLDQKHALQASAREQVDAAFAAVVEAERVKRQSLNRASAPRAIKRDNSNHSFGRVADAANPTR